MGPTWGRQDPGGPHVGPMNFAIWEDTEEDNRCTRFVLVSFDFKTTFWATGHSPGSQLIELLEPTVDDSPKCYTNYFVS